MLKKLSTTTNLKRKINSVQQESAENTKPRKLLRVVTPNITLLTLRRLLNEFPFKLTPLDGLIDMSKHQDLLLKWFDGELLELKMIYRVTDHKKTVR